MKTRLIWGGGLGLLALAAAIGAGWILSLPPAQAVASPPPISDAEQAAVVAALKPPKRARPVIAIVGANDGSEITDYLMPYGILKRANVAEVTALGTAPGPVRLYPALKVLPDATAAEFDRRHPEGADYVIVPALKTEDDPAVLAWIRSQAAKGAIVIGVCVGAKVVANAGLLDGKRATSHWWYLRGLRKEHPEVRYVADRRLVVDGRVATTTGISASMPMALNLIEAIAGRAKAEAVARDLGLHAWDLRHDSSAFQFSRPFALTALGNRMAVWNHETLGLELTPGVDEVALALTADAWSRTYRSRVATFARAEGALVSRSGVRLLPDEVRPDWPAAQRLPPVEAPAAAALDRTLARIGDRFGGRTADFVAKQLEYPGAVGVDRLVRLQQAPTSPSSRSTTKQWRSPLAQSSTVTASCPSSVAPTCSA